MKKLLLILVLVLISGCYTGNVTYLPIEKEGPFLVTKVIDGDTIVLNTTEKVRFSGINTPEKKQCYYQEAKDELTKLVLNKEVYLERDLTDKDKYKRLLRYVYVDGMMTNAYMVENGYARVFDKYAYDTKRYLELKQYELVAINNDIGVWTCPN